jgi:hypothetical protein
MDSRDVARNHRIRMEIILLLGGQCANPYGLHDKSFTDIRCLQIDHINGDGAKERMKIVGPYRKCCSQYYVHILRQIKLGSKDYQLLCANCNWIKRWENKEYR